MTAGSIQSIGVVAVIKIIQDGEKALFDLPDTYDSLLVWSTDLACRPFLIPGEVPARGRILQE